MLQTGLMHPARTHTSTHVQRAAFSQLRDFNFICRFSFEQRLIAT